MPFSSFLDLFLVVFEEAELQSQENDSELFDDSANILGKEGI